MNLTAPTATLTLKCFVIMPFSSTKHLKDAKEIQISEKEWFSIYSDWIKKAVESFPSRKIACQRSQLVPGSFIKGIVQQLNDSEIVIADVTGQKANVYYELGIRHSLKLGTIIISQDLSAVPSDLNSYYCFEYNYEKEHYKYEAAFRLFEADLHQKIFAIIDNPQSADSPVSDFLQLEHYYSRQRFLDEQQDYLYMLNSVKNIIEKFFDEIKGVKSQEDEFKLRNHMPFAFIDFWLFDSFFSAIIMDWYEEIKPEIQDEISIGLMQIRELFYRIYQIWESTTKNIGPENINLFFIHIDIVLKGESAIFDQLQKSISTIDNLIPKN